VKRAGPWAEKLSAGFRKDAFNYLLFLRLVPAFPFVIVNLVPAILGMPLWSFVVATFIGIIPGTLAFSYVGTGLESVIQAATASYQACLAGKPDAEAATCHLSVDIAKLVTPQIIIALCALAAISLLPVLIKRFAHRA
jgi:SNARE associated Golgi protein